MENGKKLVVVALALLAFEILPSYASSRMETDEYGKTLYSKKKISSKDLYSGNFFINEIGGSSFNVSIFNMMKNSMSNGTVKWLAVNEERNEMCKALVKKGEIIDCFYSDEDKDLRIIVYYVFDKKSKHFMAYNFVLTVNERQYNSYAESTKALNSLIEECDRNIDLCDKNIQKCNEIIEKCSNPTIQKSRVVRVQVPSAPLTVCHTGSASDQGSYIETIEMPPRYVNKTEYYTVPDPNYNPSAVAKAKKDLQGYNNTKASWTNKKKRGILRKKELALAVRAEVLDAKV